MCCQARHWCESRHQTAYRSATCLPTAKLQAACWTAPLAAGHNQAADLLYSSGEGLIQHGKVKHFGLSESEDCSIPGTTKLCRLEENVGAAARRALVANGGRAQSDRRLVRQVIITCSLPIITTIPNSLWLTRRRAQRNSQGDSKRKAARPSLVHCDDDEGR
jgi:hypothetical protein